MIATDIAPPASARPTAGDLLATRHLQQWLRLSVADHVCAVPIDRVLEILQVGRLTTMPRTPPVVRGVMNLRGAVVPVIDLGDRLAGRAVTLGRRSCIVVVELTDGDDFGSATMGLLVDAVYEVAEVDPDGVSPVPMIGAPVPAEYLRGIYQADGTQVHLLELDRVLAQPELAELIASYAG
jgi:purine-binding chemotaxis protein CheW